ncbi:ABC transporter substrate-binding protein [Oleomonas cavernae]|uniref:ABC transporter substrate-binding protein n=1 Tax=Oleomonas cavernae TaxID=2320859 RepID=A0A418WT28_9PROT|nr:ABC transporter substrate-binding protein [Oleomonas cavernae]RJF94414.1 ABC transporter substrate-binding protein [Oleomonas cavernae]
MAFSGLKRIVAGLALAGALAVSGAQAADKVVVASKIDTEGAVLGNIIVLLLEQAGVPVENKVSLGVTKIVRGALIAGEIDIYPEYTGNAGFFFSVPEDPAWSNFDAGYKKAAELDLAANKLVWLTPAPANNTWVIAVRSEIATEAKLVSLEDFGKWVSGGAKVKLAGSAEFVESPAALPAFQKAYGFKLTNDQLLVLSGGDTAATIKAAAEQTSGVNAAMAYGTDGALAALGLTALTDPKGVQPVYAPAPVVRAATLEKFPAIATALEPAFKTLTLETLQKLNAAVALDGIDAKTVAKDYLTKAGLLK